jgi:putative Mn2+ efflux pump MntP
MTVFTLLVLALSLSFDSFAVSVSSGLMKKQIVFKQAIRIAFFLAFFQALMPVLGWLGGVTIRQYIEPIDHWVAFSILLIIGLKMVFESFKSDENKTLDPLRLRTILSMAFATSIDALAVGISFALIKVNLIMAVAIIGSVTFIVSMLGILLGKKCSARFGKPLEALGGIMLIAIGVKIVLEHYSV